MIDHALRADRLHALVRAAAEAHTAATADEVFATICDAIVANGLSAFVAVPDPELDTMTVRHVAFVQPWLAQVESLLGRPAIGTKLAIKNVPVLRAAVEARRAAIELDSCQFVAAAVPWLDARAARALAHLLGVRQAIAAPLLDGARVLAVLTVWGAELSEVDVPTVQLLGYQAGSALAALQLRAAEHARAEEAQRAHAELAALFDAVGDAIVVFGLDGQLLQANQRARSWCERHLGGMPGSAAEWAALRQDVRPPVGPVEAALRGEEIGAELLVADLAGGQRRLHYRSAPVRDTAGRVRGVVLVVRELTELHDAIAGRARLEGAVATARLVVHELNNRLALLAGYGDLLTSLPPDEAARAAETMVDAAMEMTTLTRRLQQIVRFEETDLGLGRPMLDLDAATAPEPAGERPSPGPAAGRGGSR